MSLPKNLHPNEAAATPVVPVPMNKSPTTICELSAFKSRKRLKISENKNLEKSNKQKVEKKNLSSIVQTFVLLLVWASLFRVNGYTKRGEVRGKQCGNKKYLYLRSWGLFVRLHVTEFTSK